jgi:hypothetical protein
VDVLCDWERSLVQRKSLNDKLHSDPTLRVDAELAKAAEIVAHIRSLLSQVLPLMTMRDYQISLYFHALKGMTLARKLNERQRLHALISASLLAEVVQEKY